MTGAAKPYTYWYTYWVKGKDGEPITKRARRWMVKVDFGTEADGKLIRKTLTGETIKEVKVKPKAVHEEIRGNG